MNSHSSGMSSRATSVWWGRVQSDPELIKRFREEILYYNARHNIVPGMTGWAQVNGFRGDTDLSERIRCDIYYIENWNPILDIQIMFMTFVRWEGAH